MILLHVMRGKIMPDRPKVENAIVRLDYAELRDTIYEHCKLVYEGGRPPSLIGCDFIDCDFILEGPAKNTASYLSALANGGAAELVIVHMLGFTQWAPKNG